MNKLIATMALSLITAASYCQAAVPDVLELRVEGMNCSLCSDKLQAQLTQVTHANALVPKLECGLIFISTETSVRDVDAAVAWPLLSNGFNLKGVKLSSRSIEQAKGMTC